LSPEEFELLLQLATAPEISVSKLDLLKSIRGAVTELDQWLVEIHIMRLMVKLSRQSICRVERTPADDGFMLLTEAVMPRPTVSKASRS
jgi:DNA-binding response OmpR family regulator